MLQAGGDVLHKHIYEIICDIWHKEMMPDDWNESISILNSIYKVLSKILCERLSPHVTKNIARYQCGFMPNRSTTDQIFTLRQILEKTREFKTTTHHLFIDFKQA